MRFPSASTRLAAGSVLLMACATACASAGTAGAPDIPAPLARQLTPQFRHDHVAPARSTLTQLGTDVLRADPSRSMYEIVERRWPAMFRPPPGGDRDPRGDIIGVYSKAGWMGGQDVLRMVRVDHVLTVHRLSPAQEFARFGRRHAGGAVEVIWR